MKTGSFVYRPGKGGRAGRADFESPRAGEPVFGRTSLRVKADLRGAELCVLEYALGADSARGDWQMVGCYPKTQDQFVGMWASDSAVIRAGQPYGSPCALRATVLGRKGQHDETLLETVVNQQPARTRRGCGCH